MYINATVDQSVIRNSFKNYLIHVGPPVAQQSYINPLNYVTDTMKTLFISYIIEYEINETVKSLKKAMPDGIFSQLLLLNNV